MHSLFFQACLKTLGFLSHLFTINNFKPGFWVGSPQTTIKRLGTTTCGSLSRSKCWEPQPVVPNQNQKVGNHNLWFPIKINMLGTSTCSSQSKLKHWEPQIVVPFPDQNVGNHNQKFGLTNFFSSKIFCVQKSLVEMNFVPKKKFS